MRLLHLNKATSISLIKKYPKGLPNRLQHYDDWVKSWKDPHIHSYFDYFYNGEVRKYQMYMPNCQKAKEVKDTVDYNFRPGLADISRQYSLADQNFADDLELAEDIQKITLKSFFKGFRDPQTRTEIQRLALWLPIFLVTISIVLYLSVIKADDVPDTAQLEPHESYFHYRAPQMKQRVVAQIEKIHFLDKHAREVLLQAKKKALQSNQQK